MDKKAGHNTDFCKKNSGECCEGYIDDSAKGRAAKRVQEEEGREKKWVVKRIQEADYGCEERPEGEKQKVIVTLTDGIGVMKELLIEDDWLYENGIDEGSDWPAEV